MLNYKLQNNLGELGREFAGRDIDTVTGGVKSNVFYPAPLDFDHDTNEELYARKKAWADLEREQDEVKQNIKSLMRRAPQSTEIDNPLSAGVVSAKNPVSSNYRVPQDVMLEQKHSRQFEDLQARELRPDGQRSRDPLHAAEGGASDNVFSEDYKREGLTKSRDRQDKGNYGSNQDLSLSSQSKTLQTQKRRWKASDADSKERKASPLGDPYGEKTGGYGASFQNRELFSGGASGFENQKKDSRASPNLNTVDKNHTRSNASSVSPDRAKAPGGPETSKPAEPVQPKKASLFGGGKKERLNPLMKKSSQQKMPAESNQSSAA